MSDYQQVAFTEQPIQGRPVRMRINGMEALSSVVASIQTHPNYPGWYWIITQSGSQYTGQIVAFDGSDIHQRTSYGIPSSSHAPLAPPQNYNVLADWIIITVLVFFTPVGIALMWRNCNWLNKVKWSITAGWVVCVWLWLSTLVS